MSAVLGTHEAPITLAKVMYMARAGTLAVYPEEWVELVGNCAALRRYAPDPWPVVTDGALLFEGPQGAVAIVADTEVPRGRHRWSDGVPRPIGPVQKCSYCGAPGQRIGARCEYCQVAVFR